MRSFTPVHAGMHDSHDEEPPGMAVWHPPGATAVSSPITTSALLHFWHPRMRSYSAAASGAQLARRWSWRCRRAAAARWLRGPPSGCAGRLGPSKGCMVASSYITCSYLPCPLLPPVCNRSLGHVFMGF